MHSYFVIIIWLQAIWFSPVPQLFAAPPRGTCPPSSKLASKTMAIVTNARVCFLTTFIIGVVLLLLGILLTLVIFPAEMEKEVDAQMNLWDNKSEGYNNFVSSMLCM
jgi:hypothetical protein